MDNKSTKFRHIAALIVFIMTIGISNSLIAQQDIHINTNTTWSTDHSPNGHVFIENGATLTITQGVTIRMPENKYILVREESKIVANGATFTNSVTHHFWFGIYASGYGNSIDQVSFLNAGGENQPELIFTNCSFSGMQYGINNANPLTGNPNANSGGIIKIKGCDFIGNSIGVRFYKYVHYRNSNLAREKSYIYNSNFEIWGITTLPSPIGVFMNGTVGLRIHGCYFYSKASELTAIQASLSFFSVNDYYTGIPLNPVFVSESKFSNCKYGIKANHSNALMGKIVIKNSEFVAVKNSIYALNSDNLEIYSNTITLEKNTLRPNDNVGIYLENCATFYVENNNITTWVPSITIPEDHYGIVAHNCGENNNRFYRNTVDNCEYNIVGQEHNRGVQNQTGLQFICNSLSQTYPVNLGTDNSYYMAALTTQPNNLLHGINDWQTGGAYDNNTNQYVPSSSAYNVIPDRALPSGSKFDFYNEHIRQPFDIRYYNPKNKLPVSQVLESNTINPTYEYYGDYIWVADEPSYVNSSNQCPSTVPSNSPIPINITNERYEAVHIAYGPLKSTFAGYENNGDHQFMLNQVNGMDNTNYTIVYYYLMNNHPSTDVIAIAVANDIMPNYMCTDVLITNSYGIKSQLVRNALAGRQNQLTSSQMNAVKTAAQSQSQYENYLMELAALRTQINTLSQQKYNYYYNTDNEELDVNEVITVLNENKNFYSYVSLMMYYFDKQNISEAERNFMKALSTDEISDYEKENLETLFPILITIFKELEGKYSKLKADEISKLEDLAKTDSKSGGIAKSILMSEYQHDYDPILLKATKSNMRIAAPIKHESKISKMQIMPNPADNYIGITINDEFQYPLQLNIYDVSGKLVMQKEVSNINTIMIDKLNTGMYQAIIIDNNNKMFRQKLIIK